MVLQNIHGMPQSESAKFIACATANLKCNKNQECGYDESSGDATCVCKNGFTKNPTYNGDTAKQKCINIKKLQENQNPVPNKPVIDRIKENPCLINSCSESLNEKCIPTPNDLNAPNFICECEEGFIRSKDGIGMCIQDPTTSTTTSPTTSAIDRDLEQQSDTFALTPEVFQEFAGSINDFTQDFMRELWEEGDNVVFSPFSLHSVLSILISGVTPGSTTEKELLLALGRVRNVQRIEAVYARIMDNYEKELASGKWELTIGNRLWTTKNNFQKMNSGYMEKINGIYAAGFDDIDDKNPEVEINNWVNETTKGKIEKIVEAVPADIALLIVNALYFKAPWNLKFDMISEPKPFTLTNGTKVLTKMMVGDSKNYASSTINIDKIGEITALSVPYKEERFEMVFLMPNDPQKLDFLSAQWNEKKDDPFLENIFDLATRELEESKRNSGRDYIVTIPKFNIDSNIPAGKYLKQLGVNAAFEEGDFEQILSKDPLKLSDVKHKVTIEVTEEGTVGAAASAVELVVFGGFSDEPTIININKPFMFYVYDTLQKVIIFAGKYTNPAS